MATVTNQNIPASLQDEFADLMLARVGPTTSQLYVSILPAVRRAIPIDPMNPFSAIATEAATWLTARWIRPADKYAASLFFADRRAEILGGQFNTTYWTQESMLSDLVEYGSPTVKTYTAPINPNYSDPLRRPTKCEFKNYSSIYPLSQANDSPTSRRPGFEGAVISGAFRDLWMAQRKITYSLTARNYQTDLRPIVIVINTVTRATSTIRGNRIWFTIMNVPIFYHNTQGDPTRQWMLDHFARDELYTFPIPPQKAGGWTHTVTRTIVRSGRRLAQWKTQGLANRIAIRIASAPTLGRYFSRNDRVDVRHEDSVALYVAK